MNMTKWRPEKDRLLEKMVKAEKKLMTLEEEFKRKFGTPWPEYNSPEAEMKHGR